MMKKNPRNAKKPKQQINTKEQATRVACSSFWQKQEPQSRKNKKKIKNKNIFQKGLDKCV